MSGDQGRFTWYELMSTDPQAGKEFYTSLTGWKVQPWEGAPAENEMEYDMFVQGEQPVAGCMQLPEQAAAQGAPTHWLGYIHCDDLAATRAKAIELGATELHAEEVPEVGAFAIMHDPQHAVIGFFQPASDPQPEAPRAPGRFTWHELYADDYEKAFSFYAGLFGWEVMDDMDMGEMGIYRIFGRDGQQLGGMMNRPQEMPAPGWMYYVCVPSVDAAADAVKAAGGHVTLEPMEVPGGDRILMGMDPQGGMFALHSMDGTADEA